MPPADAPALAGALLSLLEQPDRRATLVTDALTRVHERFSATAWVTRLEALYSRVRAGRGVAA